MKTISLICSNCDLPFDRYIGEYNRLIKRGKTEFFCCYSCAMTHNGKSKRADLVEINCKNCNNPFTTKKVKFIKKCCCVECAQELNKTREVTKRLIVKKRNKVNKICEVCKKNFLTARKKVKFCCKKCADAGKDCSKCGGYRSKGGRGKSGWYKGYWCDSSWELAWVLHAIDNNIWFERNTHGFDYYFNSKKQKYYPDFKIAENEYLEIKGYDSPQWIAKKSQFNKKLTIIGKNEIFPFIQYAKKKYGVNFIDMYDNK